MPDKASKMQRGACAPKALGRSARKLTKRSRRITKESALSTRDHQRQRSRSDAGEQAAWSPPANFPHNILSLPRVPGKKAVPSLPKIDASSISTCSTQAPGQDIVAAPSTSQQAARACCHAPAPHRFSCGWIRDKHHSLPSKKEPHHWPILLLRSLQEVCKRGSAILPC